MYGENTVLQVRRVAAAAIVSFGWLCGCGDAGRDAPRSGAIEQPEAEVREAVSRIREALPEAAGFPVELFDRMANTGETPALEEAGSHPLSLVLLTLPHGDDDLDPDAAAREFAFAESPNPARLANAMLGTRHRGFASMIQPDGIEDCSLQLDGDKGTGTVKFSLGGVVQGRVDFIASRSGQAWRIERFSMPTRGVMTELTSDGRWQASGAALASPRVRLPIVTGRPSKFDSTGKRIVVDLLWGDDPSAVRVAFRGVIVGEFPTEGEGLRDGFRRVRETTAAHLTDGSPVVATGSPIQSVSAIFRVDRDVAAGTVRRVLMAAYQEGFQNVDFAVRSETREGTHAVGGLRGNEPSGPPSDAIFDEITSVPVVLRLASRPDGELAFAQLGEVRLGETRSALDRIHAEVLKLLGPENSRLDVHLEFDDALKFAVALDAGMRCLGYVADDTGTFVQLASGVRLFGSSERRGREVVELPTNDATLTVENVEGVVSPIDDAAVVSSSQAFREDFVGKATMSAVGAMDDNGLKMQFKWCPAGEFVMGSPGNEPGRKGDEDQVRVTLTKGFWLGRTEVTQGEWKLVMGTEPWKGKQYVTESETHAATYVSWKDAATFCRKLTEQERNAGRLSRGWEYRLPSEAEWEYACRAGSDTTYSFGDDASRLGVHAWWGGVLDSGNAKTEQYAHAVGTKKANPWGFLDMHGNVHEWCNDWYADALTAC